MSSLAVRLTELDDVQLEAFVEIWVEQRQKVYDSVERIGGANDKGRDVIGFLTAARHEGAWDLFQCKRKTLGSKLGKSEALLELGKMFFHHTEGSYATLPAEYTFVSPRGVVGSLLDLLNHPSQLQAALLAGWNEHCAKKITAKIEIPLCAKITAAIQGYDFKNIRHLTAPTIVKDPAAKPALFQILGAPPGEAPSGAAPQTIQAEEREYLEQLRAVYAEAADQQFQDLAAVFAHGDYGAPLREQRTRYFEAEAFKRFHRDNTDPKLVNQLQNDVYLGVVDIHRQDHTRLVDRLNAVMTHASLLPASIIGTSARIPVKQGMCHHLANEGRLTWTP